MLCSLVLLSTALAAEPEAPVAKEAETPETVETADPYELDRPPRKLYLWVIPVVGGVVAQAGMASMLGGYTWMVLGNTIQSDNVGGYMYAGGKVTALCGAGIAGLGGIAVLANHYYQKHAPSYAEQQKTSLQVAPLVSPTLVGVQGHW
ncbi:MAG TPA: hypothetical protein PLA94_07755 [Myxococcota bacterium]|nr:hypothetical protein [Myxococcota bacterium]